MPDLVNTTNSCKRPHHHCSPQVRQTRSGLPGHKPCHLSLLSWSHTHRVPRWTQALVSRTSRNGAWQISGTNTRTSPHADQTHTPPVAMRLLLSTLLLLPLASAYSWQSLASLLSSPTTNLKGLAWKATHTTAGTAAVPLHLEEILTAAASLPNKASHGVLPVVLWHGMGDSCCDPHTTGAVKNYLQEQLGAVQELALSHETGRKSTCAGWLVDSQQESSGHPERYQKWLVVLMCRVCAEQSRVIRGPVILPRHTHAAQRCRRHASSQDCTGRGCQPGAAVSHAQSPSGNQTPVMRSVFHNAQILQACSPCCPHHPTHCAARCRCL